jgi:hypothetical protein
VVRTPSKLTTLLNTNGVMPATSARHLTVHQGNSKDVAALGTALLIRNRPVDFILSGVGAVPKFSKFLVPSIDDPLVCSGSMTALISAVKALNAPVKPVVVAITSTGISNFGRDIPVPMVPLYHWLLAVPHKDKKMVEVALSEDAEAASPTFGSFIAVRPSLLTNGVAKGVENVKVGVESQKGIESLAIGYTISREDVGNWIFEEVLKAGKGRKGGEYKNTLVTLTY